MIRQTIWFLFFSLLAVSCLDQPDCFSLNNNIIGISFRKLSNNTADTVIFKSITATGAKASNGGDTVFLSPSELGGGPITSKNLPLDIYHNATSFKFEGSKGTFDLMVGYLSKAQFVSEDCGEKFVVSDLQASSAGFDSVRVVSTTPKARDVVAGTHIEVFRCPNTTRMKVRFLSPVKITQIQSSFAEIAAPSAAVSTILLPLNPAEDLSTYTFNIDGFAQPQTLKVSYIREPRTLFKACGEQAIISALAVDTVASTFKKEKLIRASIQDPNLTNIEISN